jgi:hypothetical protein
VATINLPADPTVGHFRRLARRLQRALRAGDPEATALAARYGFPAAEFPLSAAQLVVARECGFSSWPALRRQLELLAGYRRDPDAVPAVTTRRRSMPAPTPSSRSGSASTCPAGTRGRPRCTPRPGTATSTWSAGWCRWGPTWTRGTAVSTVGRSTGPARHPDVVSFLSEASAETERARGGPGPGSRPAGTAP